MNLLVIGGGSKLAKRFLSQLDKNEYTVYTTYRHIGTEEESNHAFSVDLKSESSLRELIKDISRIRFDATLFFSSTYSPDSKGKDLITQYQDDFLCNALSFAYICKNIKLNSSSQIIAFGDSGLLHPKKNFSSYSLSKLALE